MTGGPTLVDAWRFRAFFSDRDVAISTQRETGADGMVVATSRAGGAYVVRDGSNAVWLHDSEGGEHLLAPSEATLLHALGSGFTVRDLIDRAAIPSGRPAEGILRWLQSLDAK